MIRVVGSEFDRQAGESFTIRLGDRAATVTVVSARGGTVRIRVDYPPGVQVEYAAPAVREQQDQQERQPHERKP